MTGGERRPLGWRAACRLAVLAGLVGLLLFAAFYTAARRQRGASETLARRLLTAEHEPAGLALELLPLRAPPGFGVVPLPHGARLLGSLLYRDGEGRLLRAEVALEVPGDTGEVVGFLSRGFADLGWSGWVDPMPGGFTPAQLDLNAAYCTPAGGLSESHGEAADVVYATALYAPSLARSSRGGESPVTDLRLAIDYAVRFNPCPEEGVLVGGEPASAPLPLLQAPRGGAVAVHGWTEVEGQLSSTAILTSALELGEVLDHYGRQLVEAGWERTERSDGGGVGTSRWRVVAAHGQLLTGLLVATRLTREQILLTVVLFP